MPQSISQWAQSMLALPNLIVAVSDTASVKPDADLLRLVFANADGEILYNQVIRSQRTSDPNTLYTGISEERLLEAPTIEEVWDDVLSYLKGSVVLSWSYDFLASHLTENAEHYKLPAPPLVGFCLQRKAESYFDWGSWMKLSAACEEIGHPLPDPPMAFERATAIGVLLNSMAQDLPKAPEKPADASTALDELPNFGDPF